MNRLVIPSILAATTLVAGMFAFMPIEKASTIHTTIQGTSVNIKTVASASNSCDDNADDGTITWDADAGIDGVALISLYIDADEATDAGDTLGLEINADSTEIFGVATTGAALLFDDAPDTRAAIDREILKIFDLDGGVLDTASDGALPAPIGFLDTLSVDVACTRDNGDVDYVITGVFLVPEGDGTPIAVTDTIP